jgi:uncharacterized glyoxalase superfamily protein PhnB
MRIPTSVYTAALVNAQRTSLACEVTHAKGTGVTLASEPHDTEWKSRAFEVTDPSGFLPTISSEKL